MTVTEATRALNLQTADVVYRLLRIGKLKGTKIGGTWDIDADSVEQRKRSVALKRSSRSNTQAERARRVAEAEGLFQ
jgi:excisionase family DNA binding protein